MDKIQFLVSGGISGAITDPYSKEALKHAELYYQEIRSFSTDVDKIARNTGLSYDQVMLIKNYLFVDEHYLEGEIRRFDANFEIAESWRRLAFDPKNIQPHDILLLQHEMHEYKLILQGYSQTDAHNKTNQFYNYTKASKEFYNVLRHSKSCGKLEERENSNDMDVENDFIGGAVSYLDHCTH